MMFMGGLRAYRCLPDGSMIAPAPKGVNGSAFEQLSMGARRHACSIVLMLHCSTPVIEWRRYERHHGPDQRHRGGRHRDREGGGGAGAVWRAGPAARVHGGGGRVLPGARPGGGGGRGGGGAGERRPPRWGRQGAVRGGARAPPRRAAGGGAADLDRDPPR